MVNNKLNKKITVTVDKFWYNEAKQHGLNMSAVLNDALPNYVVACDRAVSTYDKKLKKK